MIWVPLKQKVKYHAIHSGLLWMGRSVSKYYKMIFLLQQDNNMHNNEDSSRTIIQNIEVKLPKNFWIVKYRKSLTGHPTVLALTRWRTCGRSWKDELRNGSHQISMNQKFLYMKNGQKLIYIL